jgi:hypothetical protein
LVFVSGRLGGFGRSDLDVSFRRQDGGQGDAVALGGGINTEHTDFCPMVTLDERHLFFARRRGGATWADATAGDVYGVDAKVLDRLRPCPYLLGLDNRLVAGLT